MKRRKSVPARIALAMGAIACGLGVQVIGAGVDKLVYIQISPQYSFGLLGLLSGLLGFVVMLYLVYRWAVTGVWP